jgi:hypothetical protein
MIENKPFDAVSSQNGKASSHKIMPVPGRRWVVLWTVLSTVAFPAAYVLAAPLSAALIPLSNSRLLPAGVPAIIAFFLGYSLVLAFFQWLLLRSYLLHARRWFLATFVGLLASGALAGGVALIVPSAPIVLPLLIIGGIVGVSQWLALRRVLPNAFWIIIIDLAGYGILAVNYRTITNLPEILIFLLILSLPGLASGVGLRRLLQQARPEGIEAVAASPIPAAKRPVPIVRLGLGVAALVPAFFLCIWVYAAAQLALAKNAGIYPSVEEATIETSSRGWGNAKVVRVENVHVSVNSFDGSQPHVWYGTADIILDRIPTGLDRSRFSGGSYYLHVKEGWVHVPEGAFPEFIGWVMELYGLEDVNKWATENK